MTSNQRLVLICLTAVAVSLLLVGVVSGTLVRHVIQVIPVGIALALSARRSASTPYAALAVFLFWFFIMSLIWLWLLGLARIVTGHFSHAEIGLTMVIGVAALVGCWAALGWRTDRRWTQRVAVFLLFAAMQIGAMWASLRPAIADR